jgi:hypothetical protein
MLLEIKARPDHGTKSQAQFQQMDADVARVAQHPECALFFVFDQRIYRSFSNEKSETRGRHAVAADWFRGCFPLLAEIATDRWLIRYADRDLAKITLAFKLATHTRADDTILVIGARGDSEAWRAIPSLDRLQSAAL